MGRKDGKPRGRVSAYAFFVQTCREEHKRKHPAEPVVFADFSRKCAAKWKGMNEKEKKRFNEMATKDKGRYDLDMENYVPPPGEAPEGKRKRTKDPNAPKRSLSAFFFFCGEERGAIKGKFPSYGVGDIAKELGKGWATVTDKTYYENLAAKDKLRYEKEMADYKAGGTAVVQKSQKVTKAAAPVRVEEPEDDDDDEDDEDDDDESEDGDE